MGRVTHRFGQLTLLLTQPVFFIFISHLISMLTTTLFLKGMAKHSHSMPGNAA
jgi:hypothetical protein